MHNVTTEGKIVFYYFYINLRQFVNKGSDVDEGSINFFCANKTKNVSFVVYLVFYNQNSNV